MLIDSYGNEIKVGSTVSIEFEGDAEFVRGKVVKILAPFHGILKVRQGNEYHEVSRDECRVELDGGTQ